MAAARRPRSFDVQCWNDMGEHQRLAEVARHNGIAAAGRRYVGQRKRAEATFDRTLRRARQELELAVDVVNQAYRAAEDADPKNREGW